jgi:hypothetical protein
MKIVRFSKKGTLKLGNIGTRTVLLVIILFVMAVLYSCAKKIPFETSTVVPAAEGWVKVKKEKNNNYQVELRVMRLADPKRLTPPKSIYVVWIETEQNGLKNIGQLRTSGSLLSNSLKSSLQTLTPYKPIAFFITAEDNIHIEYPDSQVVLKTDSLSKF